MFAISEAGAAAIRAVYEQDGELSAAIELRRPFPCVTDNAQGARLRADHRGLAAHRAAAAAEAEAPQAWVIGAQAGRVWRGPRAGQDQRKHCHTGLIGGEVAGGYRRTL